MESHANTIRCRHGVQVYEEESSLLEVLARYVRGSIEDGAVPIVIATPGHLAGLGAVLRDGGADFDAAIARGDALVADAESTLASFLVNRWPDYDRFRAALEPMVERARGATRRPVRAFGEMVVLLWQQRAYAATLELERLWNRFCESEEIELLCGYPRSAFAPGTHDAVAEVLRVHSHSVPG